MNHFESQIEDHPQSITEAEATLRLVAQQPSPEGLAGRVHKRLAQERVMRAAEEPERRGFWRLWLPAHRLQFAGAAVLAGVVAVSMLSVRHPSPKTPQAVVPVPAQSGSFGTSAAQAHPKTLTPIQVPVQPKKKKPSAGHSAKHAAQSQAASEASATPAKP